MCMIEFLALVKTSTGMSASGGTVGMTLAQIKPGQLKATLPGVRTPMQLQQIPIQQQQKRNNAAAGTSRFVTSPNYINGKPKKSKKNLFKFNISNHKNSSMKSFTGTGGTSGATNAAGQTKATSVGGTLIVQNPKNLQPSTVTVQQIMRQQPNLVLGKRIIPVSVSSQNARQTIQVKLNSNFQHFSFSRQR